MLKIHERNQPASDRKFEGKYVGGLGGFFELELAAFKHYRQTHGVGDYYVNTPGVRQISAKVHGVKVSPFNQACRVRSRWFDYDAKTRNEPDGASYRLRSAQKIAWISHDDMVSDEFGEFLDQAENCFEKLKYTYIIDPSAPAAAS